jgi:hypothetical protein
VWEVQVLLYLVRVLTYNPDMPYADKNEQREYQRKWMRRRKANWLLDKKCAVCGSRTALEIDHVDPELKISHRVWSWAVKKRDIELAKCQVLCARHHVEKSTAARQHDNHGTHLSRRKHKCKCFSCMSYVRESKRRSRARIAAGIRLGCGYRSDLADRKLIGV